MAPNKQETSKEHIISATAIGGVSAAKKLNDLHNISSTYKELDWISNCVQDMAHDNPENIEKMYNQLSDKTKQCLPFHKFCNKTEIAEEIRQLKVKMARETIYLGGICSAVLIILQVKEMLEIWSALKAAENIADESKSEMEILKGKMEILSTSSIELKILVSEYESNHGNNESEAKKLFRKIANKKDRLQMNFVDVNRMINDLKVTVNGQKQCLMSVQKQATSSGILCAFNAITNAIQFFQFVEFINCTEKAVQIGITTIFSLMAVANVKMYRITENILRDIRDMLQQISEISKQLVAMQNFLCEIADWLEMEANDIES